MNKRIVLWNQRVPQTNITRKDKYHQINNIRYFHLERVTHWTKRKGKTFLWVKKVIREKKIKQVEKERK